MKTIIKLYLFCLTHYSMAINDKYLWNETESISFVLNRITANSSISSEGVQHFNRIERSDSEEYDLSSNSSDIGTNSSDVSLDDTFTDSLNVSTVSSDIISNASTDLLDISTESTDTDSNNTGVTPKTSRPTYVKKGPLFRNRNNLWPIVFTIIISCLLIVSVIVCCFSKHRDLSLEKRQKRELQEIRAKMGKNKKKIKLNSKEFRELEKGRPTEESEGEGVSSVRSEPTL